MDRPLTRVVLSAWGACMLVGAADFAVLVRRAAVDAETTLPTLGAVLATAWVAAAMVGGTEAAVFSGLEPMARGRPNPRRFWRWVVLALLSIVVLGLYGLLAEPSWHVWPTSLKAVVVGIAALVSAALYLATWLVDVALDRALQRRGLRIALAVVAGALGVGVAVVDRALLPRLYPRLHDGLLLVEILLVQIGVFVALPRRIPNAIPALLVASGAAVAVAIASWSLESDPRLTFVLFDQAPLARRVLLSAHFLSDRDGDGHASMFGGRDCDDGDPSVHPGHFDWPEDGKDQDCSGDDASFDRVETPRPSSPPRVGHFDVLLLTIDTLRPDHLGAYGYARPTSPNIDALARQSLRFERAYAQANATAASIPSLLTGRYASTSPWLYAKSKKLRPGWPRLEDDKNVTIAEILARAGYRTAAVGQTDFIEPMGLGQGFETVEEGRLALEYRFQDFLAAGDGRPWFFWMHFEYPHSPYVAHPEYPFGDGEIDRYDSEIAMADEKVGVVLDTLGAYGRPRETVVILSSDHGEEFGEHGATWHGSALYEQQTRVPLLLRAPGLSPGVVKELAELVDVLPTITSLVGLEAPLTDGQSLLNLLSGAPRTRPKAYSEHYFGSLLQRSLVIGRYKLIEKLRLGVGFELYDVDRDPWERENLAHAEPDVLKMMQAEISAVVAQSELALLVSASRREPGAVARLARTLPRLSRARLQIAAARILGEASDPATIAPMERAARSGNIPERSRLAVLDALASMEDVRARDALGRLANVDNPRIAGAAKKLVSAAPLSPGARSAGSAGGTLPGGE